MPITFHTEHLNHRLYHRLFNNLCLHTNIEAHYFMKRWDIHIYPSTEAQLAFFEHIKSTTGQTIKPGIPSGATGKYEMKLFLIDTKNTFADRSNHVVTMHEFCHARLYMEHGTNDHIWVNAVHDKIDYQGRILKSFPISFWYWRKIFWRRIMLNVIDIRGEL